MSDQESTAVDRLVNAHFASLKKSGADWHNQAEQVRQSYADTPRDSAPNGDLIDALLNSAALITVLTQLLDALAVSYQAHTLLSREKVALLRQHLNRWQVEVCELRARINREKADDSAEGPGANIEFEAVLLAIRRVLERRSRTRKR